jgi:hypothetical protein
MNLFLSIQHIYSNIKIILFNKLYIQMLRSDDRKYINKIFIAFIDKLFIN